jgi:lipopolysaccharide core heptose(I) kinase
MAEYYLRQELESLPGTDSDRAQAILRWADALADRAGTRDIYRNKEGRKTLRFVEGGRPYFLKLHTGVGWGEILKNYAQFRAPVIDAGNEYRAVLELQAIGVDTMSVAAYARSGNNPARIHSMLVTDELVNTVTLEDYCADWAQQPPAVSVRLKLIAKLADSAGRMHRAGINHRDFYLCHFHLDEQSLQQGPVRCHLIDLHRAVKRSKTPRRWLVKDLAGLYFSAMDCGLTRRDLLRFMRLYFPGGLRQALSDPTLWEAVSTRALKLYRKHHGRQPPVIAGVEVVN